jgi:ferredoxin
MTCVITDACVDVKDRSCVNECPVDCIYEGDRALYINPDECIDCGACEAACPSNAVLFDIDVPEGQKSFQAVAVEWVAEHAAAGGATRRGVIGIDHSLVAGLPRKAES